jgi:hypothetical protein
LMAEVLNSVEIEKDFMDLRVSLCRNQAWYGVALQMRCRKL